MTAYVSNHQKKKATLARREADLLRAIGRRATPEKLREAAEAVREAQIRVFECQLSQVAPCDEADKDRMDRTNTQIEEWRALTAQDVLRRFDDQGRTQHAVAE